MGNRHQTGNTSDSAASKSVVNPAGNQTITAPSTGSPSVAPPTNYNQNNQSTNMSHLNP